MIGIEFEKENIYDRFLNELLDGVNLEQYKLIVIENEVMTSNIQNRFLNNHEILNLINDRDKSDYYITFLNLQIFSKGEKNVEIRNYQDFFDSSCEFVLLISDSVYVEMYFKNNIIREIVLNNLKIMGVSYNIKTKENDCRYIMSVV